MIDLDEAERMVKTSGPNLRIELALVAELRAAREEVKKLRLCLPWDHPALSGEIAEMRAARDAEASR